jgi:hypothetical protein
MELCLCKGKTKGECQGECGQCAYWDEALALDCQTCIGMECCPEVLACAADSLCIGLRACMNTNPCPGKPLYQCAQENCGAQFEAFPLYQAVRACGDYHCPDMCAGISCDAKFCPHVSFFEACCVGRFGECGLLAGPFINAAEPCVASDQPGTLDTTCPAKSVIDSVWPGCCRPNGECGLFDANYGLGCVPHIDPDSDAGPQPCTP